MKRDHCDFCDKVMEDGKTRVINYDVQRGDNAHKFTRDLCEMCFDNVQLIVPMDMREGMSTKRVTIKITY